MDTVSPSELTLQEQINLLRKRVEALEKRPEHKKRKKTWAKLPPLTPEEEKQAKSLILPVLKSLPKGKMVNSYFISQQKIQLRRLGSVKVRNRLEELISLTPDFIKKEGKGKTTLYCLNKE